MADLRSSGGRQPERATRLVPSVPVWAAWTFQDLPSPPSGLVESGYESARVHQANPQLARGEDLLRPSGPRLSLHGVVSFMRSSGLDRVASNARLTLSGVTTAGKRVEAAARQSAPPVTNMDLQLRGAAPPLMLAARSRTESQLGNRPSRRWTFLGRSQGCHSGTSPDRTYWRRVARPEGATGSDLLSPWPP